METHIYRDCDVRFRLRKVVVEIWTNPGPVTSDMVDRTRMFAGLFFSWRLNRRVRMMRARAEIMIAAAAST